MQARGPIEIPGSDSVHGCVRSRLPSGFVLRRKGQQVRPRHGDSQAILARLGNLASRWKTVLTIGQQNDWNAYATANPYTKTNGQVVTLLGIQEYCRVNMKRLLVGGTITNAAPPLSGKPAFAFQSVTRTIGGILVIQFDNTLPWTTDPLATAYITDHGIQRPFTSKRRNGAHLIGTFPGRPGIGYPSPVVIIPSYGTRDDLGITVKGGVVSTGGAADEEERVPDPPPGPPPPPPPSGAPCPGCVGSVPPPTSPCFGVVTGTTPSVVRASPTTVALCSCIPIVALGTSQRLLGAVPSSALLVQELGNPCTWSRIDPNLWTLEQFSGLICGGAPTSTQPVSAFWRLQRFATTWEMSLGLGPAAACVFYGTIPTTPGDCYRPLTFANLLACGISGPPGICAAFALGSGGTITIDPCPV